MARLTSLMAHFSGVAWTMTKEQTDADVLAVLLENRGPISIPVIEFELKKRGNWAHTMDVRDAVWRLIDRNAAEFTPGREVVAKWRARQD
jgi:hypothetical protein